MAAACDLPAQTASNLSPQVKILAPPDGAIFVAPLSIPICAGAGDRDGYVATVEFFADNFSLGIRTNLCPACVNPVNPFCLLWSNVPPGKYVLTAKATDNGGASTLSAPVNITVLPPPPPPTNLPPWVRIISPPNGAVFRAPADVPLFAYALDPDDAVTTVEFFAGTNSLGLGSVVPCPTNPPCPLCPIRVCPTNVYVLVWSNAPVGLYVLTAQATDARGATGVSGPVHIAILPSPPPPTNRPPVVSIVATDPIAIEGTNCWPWLGATNATPTWSNWPSAAAFCRYFTNCGPKNATFVVRRFGTTNDALTVNYAIGGTATNGVDYVALPGNITIPAGQRRALITVVPIDDSPPDITSTVVLRLKPDTNYFVGLPAKAAAIILDSDRPRWLTGLLPDRSFHLNAAGPDGAWFHIEYSTDMLNWTPVCTNQVINGSIDFVDPDAPGDRARFYRAVPEADPPPD